MSQKQADRVGALDPLYSPPDEVAEAVAASDDPRGELDEAFTSEQIQRLRWAYGKREQETKRERVEALIAESREVAGG
jgi:hypothetical protein